MDGSGFNSLLGFKKNPEKKEKKKKERKRKTGTKITENKHKVRKYKQIKGIGLYTINKGCQDNVLQNE